MAHTSGSRVQARIEKEGLEKAAQKHQKSDPPENEKEGASKARGLKMRALYRCTPASDACPSSGSAVLIAGPKEQANCPVCRRPFTLRGRPQRGQWVAAWPTHRSPAVAAQKRAAERKGYQRAKVETLVGVARQAQAKGTPTAKAQTHKAVGAVLKMAPGPRRDKLVAVLERGLDASARRARARARTKANLKMPGDANKLVEVLLGASGIDDGTVEPNDWLEYLSALIPFNQLERISKMNRYKQIRAGLVALMRVAKPRDWLDLERGSVPGLPYSALQFARGFRGLENLRLPDSALDALAIEEANQAYGVPF